MPPLHCFQLNLNDDTHLWHIPFNRFIIRFICRLFAVAQIETNFNHIIFQYKSGRFGLTPRSFAFSVWRTVTSMDFCGDVIVVYETIRNFSVLSWGLCFWSSLLRLDSFFFALFVELVLTTKNALACDTIGAGAFWCLVCVTYRRKKIRVIE